MKKTKQVEKTYTEKLKETISKQVFEELKNVDKTIKKYIESALLSIVGLEKRYSNDYEIDHCNGRSSVLIDAFRSVAEVEAKKIAAQYKPSKEELTVFKSAFEKEFRSQFNYVIRDVATQKAKELAKNIVDEMNLNVDEIMGTKE